MKKLLEVIKSNSNNYLPIWLMRQAGRYLPEYREVRSTNSFLDMCYNSKLAAKVTLQPIERFDFDAAIIFSDILLIPQALGMELVFDEGKGPILTKLEDRSDINKLNDTTIEKNLEPVYEALTIVKKGLSSDKTLIGFAGAPWTLAAYMIEGRGGKNFSIAREFVINNPEEFKILMDKLVDAVARHLIMQIRAGADVIQLFDSWAGLLSETEFRKCVIEPTIKVVKIIKNEFPHTPIIGFPRGAGFLYEEYSQKTGIDILGVDQNVPVDYVVNTIQKTKIIQGNLDPIYLLSKDQEILHQEILNIKNNFKRPFIFNLGHGVLPNTPLENVKFLIDTVRKN
jgi:uroporphyrinogen decarboxylase